VGYQGGSSIWEESENQLEARLADEFDNLGGKDSEAAQALKTHNIDRLKDVIVEDPEKYGLPEDFDPYTMTEEQLESIDWDQAFKDVFIENGERDLTEDLSDQEVENINDYKQPDRTQEAEGAAGRSDAQKEEVSGQELTWQEMQDRMAAEDVNEAIDQGAQDRMEAFEKRDIKNELGEIFQGSQIDDKGESLLNTVQEVVNVEDGISDPEREKLTWLADNPDWLESPDRVQELFTFAEKNNLNYEQSREVLKIEEESIFKNLSKDKIMEYYSSLNGIEALESDKKTALIELFHDPTPSSTEALCADILDSDHLRKVTSSLDDGKLNLHYDLVNAMDFEVIISPNGSVYIDGPWGWDKKFDSIEKIDEILAYPVEAVNKMKEAGEVDMRQVN
jgi:hypothetical protein